MATSTTDTGDDKQDSSTNAPIAKATSSVKASEGTSPKGAPGARTYNPLSKFSSFTYHLTLYMITPQSYSNFVENGSIAPSDMYIVAESAGTNVNGKNQRLFNLDFYIDDLSFQTYLNTTESGGPSVDSMDFNFKIYEPYGFNFLTYLKDAALKVSKTSTLPGQPAATHHMQQLYMMGIKFYGYDQQGDLVTNDSLNKLVPANTTNPSGQQDPSNGVFTRYMPITITNFQFKLDGKVTTYSIKAANVSVTIGAGSARNQIKNPQEILGKDVEELLITGPSSLENMLNKNQDDLLKAGNISIKNKFKIKFKDPNTSIKGSTIITSAEAQRIKSRMTGLTSVKTTNEVTDKNSNVTPENNNRSFSIPGGTAITQAIERVIAQSTFITNALTKNISESDENPENSSEYGSGKKMRWFIITPVAKFIGFDTIIQDFAYELTYIINEYKIPYVRSPYVKNIEGYYGPHKIYSYWFTGKNTEVLNYEQKFNGLYYMDAAVNPEPGKEMPNTTPPARVVTNSRSNSDNSTTFAKGGEVIGSLRTHLYNPADQVMASISILGDPDFIVTTTGMDYSAYKEFYGPDYSVDPHAGQVFIEIDFKQTIDYDNTTGVMAANDKISFYDYPKSLEKVKGITYMANYVVSTFTKGKFTQELNLVMWSPPKDSGTSAAMTENDREKVSSSYTSSAAPTSTAPTSEVVTGFQTVEPDKTSSVSVSSSQFPSATSTNNSIIGAITGGAITSASDVNASNALAAANQAAKSLQTPDDDNSGSSGVSKVVQQGRPRLYGT